MLVILSGVAGAGKDTIKKELIKRMENVESLPELPDDTDYFERYEREARLWSEIDKLPPTCRTVFLMSKRDGLKYETIAESLNISVKTVEAHICKAYTVLRGKAKIIYTSILMLFA